MMTDIVHLESFLSTLKCFRTQILVHIHTEWPGFLNQENTFVLTSKQFLVKYFFIKSHITNKLM